MRSKQEWIERAALYAARVGKPVALYMTRVGYAIDITSPTLEPFVMVTADGVAREVKQKWK